MALFRRSAALRAGCVRGPVFEAEVAADRARDQKQQQDANRQQDHGGRETAAAK